MRPPLTRLAAVLLTLLLTSLTAAQGERLFKRPADAGDGPLPWPEAAAALPTEAVTVAAWVRIDRFGKWAGIFSALQDNGGLEQGLLLGLQGNSFTFAVAARDSSDADGTMTYLTAPEFVTAGLWTFVAATYDGATMRLFVDGREVATSTAQRGAVWYPEDLRVAVRAYVDADENYPMGGELGQLWLTGEAWSAAQVAERYAATRDGYPTEITDTAAPRWDGVRPLDYSELVGAAGRFRVPTAQFVQPAGKSWVWSGRPVDLALSPDDALLAVKDNRGVGLFDAESWQPRQFLAFPSGGGSMHGVVFEPNGERLWATTAQNALFEARRRGGSWQWSRRIELPGPGGSGNSHATGIAVDSGRDRLWVCLSRNNSLAEVDLASGAVLREIAVGVAPFDIVLLPDDKHAVVSNWGGRRPREGEPTALSSGTPVLVDERGVASSGTVGLVDLEAGSMIKETATGLHPSDLLLDAAGDRVYVANANSDTVGVLIASTLTEVAEMSTRPAEDLPFGSASNALAMTPDRLTLLCANAGNNALAVFFRDTTEQDRWKLSDFVPTSWYPAAVATSEDAVFVADTKGIGSRGGEQEDRRRVHEFAGVTSKIDWPPYPPRLSDWTDQVRFDARRPATLRALERDAAVRDTKPVPVPARVGDPSVFQHVVYVIKENRTYDQVLGDLPQGNGDPALCLFPRRITPNHHALAEQFVLLDNWYCNGVNSADGHSWATEGNVTDHLEKSFGGFTRSYTFGDDPLTYSSTGFIWDGVLLSGLSFRNYGEMDYAEPAPKDASFLDIYRDHVAGTGKIGFTQKIGIDTLRRYSCPDYPGWNMRIPDVLRTDRFLAELQQAEKSGQWHDFMIVYLPQDHCSGLSKGMPTPNAHMADNDLALGRLVDGISHSRFWKDTCIFVVEDDPQAGFDHVDGHRSLCFVASPYTKRGAVVSEFYNQTSVLHTMQRILGLPAMNQLDAGSPLMTACFQDQPDLTPYEAIEVSVPLDQITAAADDAPAGLRRWYAATAEQDLEGFDRADEDTFNRILWHAVKGADTPYPAEWAGAHGRGLAALGLTLTGDDDD